MKNLLLTMLAAVFCTTAFAQLNCSNVNAGISLSANGGVVTLTNSSVPTATNNIYTYYTIDWGDNTTNNVYNSNASQTHTYNTSGTYTVNLYSNVLDSINNITCLDTATATISVTTSLNCNNVNAAMQASVNNGNIGRVYNTSQLSTHNGLSVTYTINWGNGTTTNASLGTNTYQYNTGGTYNVSLYMTVIDSNNNITCRDTMTSTLTVTGNGSLNCNSVNASFTKTTSGKTVTLTNNSTPNIGSGITAQYQYIWGDGTSTNKSNKTNTAHTYANNGNYSITLIATYSTSSITCTDTTIDSVSINTTQQNIINGNIWVDSTSNTDTFKVWLITFDSSTNILAAIDSQIVTVFAGWGGYSFNNKAAGSYRTKAAQLNGPTSGTGYVPTYHDSSLLWSSANIINHTGGASTNRDIYMKKGTVTSGPGFIGGNVLQGANKGTANGIAGMDILLTDANDNVITYTVTDANGDYEFKNLPIATYKIHPENLSYNTTAATVLLTNSSYTVTGLNFERSKSNKTIKPKTTDIFDVSDNSIGFNVYPNPASNNISINWNTNSTDAATITITDISGKTVFAAEKQMNTTTQINVADLQSGFYFLTVETGYSNNTQKLIIK